jgi:hypothetical protein
MQQKSGLRRKKRLNSLRQRQRNPKTDNADEAPDEELADDDAMTAKKTTTMMNTTQTKRSLSKPTKSKLTAKR